MTVTWHLIVIPSDGLSAIALAFHQILGENTKCTLQNHPSLGARVLGYLYRTSENYQCSVLSTSSMPSALRMQQGPKMTAFGPRGEDGGSASLST